MIKCQPKTLSIALKNKHSKFNFNFMKQSLSALFYVFRSILFIRKNYTLKIESFPPIFFAQTILF